MYCPFDFDPCLGVVPVFVNAGAAVLPAILAALASVITVLLSPRRLARLCVRKPYVPVLVIGCLVGAYFLGTWLWSTDDGRQPAKASDGWLAAASPSGTDWAKVAIEILRQEERARNRAEIETDAPPANDVPPANYVAATQAASATIYRGDASRCGYGGGGGPLKLTLLWDFAEEDTMVLSSPAVRDGRVYAASCYLDPPGSYGAIFCLDAATGQEQWYIDVFDGGPSGQEKEFKGFFSSPAVSADGKYLVIGQGLHADKDCELVCLNTEDGSVRWTVATPLHIEGSPAIEGDVVVAGAGAIEDMNTRLPVGDPGFVLGVRLSDGELLWKHPVADPESSPAMAEGVVYVGSGFNGSAVVALRAEPEDELKKQGLDRVLWKTATPHPATGTITLTDRLVLIGCGNADYVFASGNPQGVVIALDRDSGEVRWTAAMPDTVLGAIAVRDGKAICPVRNGEVIALDVNDQGKVLWRQEVRENAPVMAAAAFTGTHVYAVTRDGYLVVLDAADGSVLESHYLNAKGKPGEQGLSVSSPVVVDGRLCVGSETGGLRCYVGKERTP